MQFVAFQLVALGGDGLPVRDYVQVVAPQVGLGHLIGIEQASDQFVEELGLAVLVDALKTVIAQTHLECRQLAALKETQHPAIEHQFLMEAALLATATGAGCAACARTDGGGLAWSCHQMSSTENMRSRKSGSIWRSLSTRVAPPSSAVCVSTVGMLWSPLM